MTTCNVPSVDVAIVSISIVYCSSSPVDSLRTWDSVKCRRPLDLRRPLGHRRFWKSEREPPGRVGAWARGTLCPSVPFACMRWLSARASPAIHSGGRVLVGFSSACVAAGGCCGGWLVSSSRLSGWWWMEGQGVLRPDPGPSPDVRIVLPG